MQRASSPGHGGQTVDPDRAAKAHRHNDQMPIHLVGKRDGVQRNRSQAAIDHPTTNPKRKLDQACSSHSSVCIPGTGCLSPDAYQREITKQASDIEEPLSKRQRFDPEMFQDIAEALGFHGCSINCSGDPLPTTGTADNLQFTEVSHANEMPNRLSLHPNNT